MPFLSLAVWHAGLQVGYVSKAMYLDIFGDVFFDVSKTIQYINFSFSQLCI